MKFDVILPTIGRGSLADAIKSVIDQTWKSWTLMVVFDRGRVDGDFMRQFRAEFDETRINWCNLYPGETVNNWSGTDARNLAIDSGTSPWIAYIDDDDRWMNDHLETFVQMTKNGHDMLHTRGAMVQYRRRCPRRKERIRRRVSYHDEPMTVGMAHTRALFNRTCRWQPVDNHDHILWSEMIGAGGRPLTNSKVTYEFLR